MSMVAANLADSIRSSMGFPLPVSTQLSGWASAIISEITTNGRTNNPSGTVTGTVPFSGGALTLGRTTSGGTITGLSGSRLATAVATAAGFSPVTTQLTTFCTQIVSHIQTFGSAAFASGSITGTCTNIAQYTFTIASSTVSAGAVYSNNGQTFTVSSSITAQTTLVTIGTGNPTASGTLTKVSGTGPATIAFSAFTFGTAGILTGGAGANGTLSGLNGTTLANAIHVAVGFPGSTSTPLINFCTAIVNYIMSNAQVTYSSGTITGTCPAGGGSLTNGTGTNGTIV